MCVCGRAQTRQKRTKTEPFVPIIRCSNTPIPDGGRATGPAPAPAQEKTRHEVGHEDEEHEEQHPHQDRRRNGGATSNNLPSALHADVCNLPSASYADVVGLGKGTPEEEERKEEEKKEERNEGQDAGSGVSREVSGVECVAQGAGGRRGG